MTSALKFLLPLFVSLPLVNMAEAAAPDTAPGAIIPGSCPTPAYPRDALMREQEGTVILALNVEADGSVREGKVDTSSFFPRLDNATLESVKRCKFTPKREDGKPVAGWVKISYVWGLQGEPGEVRPVPFAQAPAHLRAYFMKAKEADAKRDPAARCLAFPDYPGNTWRRDEVTAQCTAAGEQAISLDLVARHLATDDLKGLDALYQRDLDRHFTKGDFSEVIHDDFNLFDQGDVADRLSREWLERAPRSAYALTARGQYLLNAAGEALGSLAQANPGQEQVRKVDLQFDEASDLLRRAVQLEPRMLPALQNLAWGAKLRNQKGIQDIFAMAEKADPGCARVASQRFAALHPLAGGSHRQVQAYADSLLPFAANRPLLRPMLHQPAQYAALEKLLSGKHGDAAALLRPVMLAVPSSSMADELTAALGNSRDNQWEMLAAALTAYRFDPGNADIGGRLGSLLVLSGEDAWAVEPLEQALRFSPRDNSIKMRLGKALEGTGELERAAQLLQQARHDPNTEQLALSSLVRIAGRMGQVSEAEDLSLAYVSTFADDAYGWLYRALALEMAGKSAQADAAQAKFKSFAGKGRWDLKAEIGVLEKQIRDIRQRR